jgi:hypothetical protein
MVCQSFVTNPTRVGVLTVRENVPESKESRLFCAAICMASGHPLAGVAGYHAGTAGPPAVPHGSGTVCLGLRAGLYAPRGMDALDGFQATPPGLSEDSPDVDQGLLPRPALRQAPRPRTAQSTAGALSTSQSAGPPGRRGRSLRRTHGMAPVPVIWASW